MVTLAASFLTYCKLVSNSSNSFYVEQPKFVNLYNYPVPHLFANQYSECPFHDRLGDHNIKSYKHCGDARAWSLDRDQQRRHFLDVVNGRIPLCGAKYARRSRGDIPSVHGKPQVARYLGTSQFGSPEKLLRPVGADTSGYPVTPKDLMKDKHPSKDILDQTIKEFQVKKEDDGISFTKPLQTSSGFASMDGDSDFLKEPEPQETLEGVCELFEEAKPKKSSGEVHDLLEGPKTCGSLESVRDLCEEKTPEGSPVEVIGIEEPKSSESLPKDQEVFGDSRPLRYLSEPSRSKLPELVDLDEEEKTKTKPQLKESSPKLLCPLQENNTEIQELTVDLLKKLDQNVVNLETTFDLFIRKNRDFIQNILECLNHEKQKQKALEQSYGKMKHENDVLRTKNEYLKMVNAKQLMLFKNELDKTMSENRAAYMNKIHKMETQIQTHQDKLHSYKLSEVKYKEVIQKGDRKVSKLEDDIQKLKKIEATLLKNYVRILNFLEDVKKQLNSDANKDDADNKTSTVVSNKDIDPDLKGVMKSALTNGMESLNVRDLSILHDAIQELNYQLCHSNEIHGFSPIRACNDIYTDKYSDDIINNANIMDNQDYDTNSNLSIYPSLQRPDGY